jgi:hypothetical protein
MANICSNDLHVQGPSTLIAEFKRAVADPDEGEVFSLTKALPVPETAEARQQILDSADPHKRRIADLLGGPDVEAQTTQALWGTLSDVYNTELLRERDLPDNQTTLWYRMDSRWSPPQDGIYGLAEMYPELRFLLTYEEVGNGVYGANFHSDGKHQVELGFESSPFALGTPDDDLEGTAAQALTYLFDDYAIPVIVSPTRPNGADKLLEDGVWSESFAEYDHAEPNGFWSAEANAHAYMFSQLKDNPTAFEKVFTEDGTRDSTQIAGFADYLRDNPDLVDPCSPEQKVNIARYLLAELFDDPVDDSTSSDIATMLTNASPIEVITFLLSPAARPAERRDELVNTYTAATYESAS